MAEFKDRIKQLRLDKKLLQKDLAEYLEITVRAYQYYEAGTNFPDFKGLQKLADYFQVSVDYLMGRDNPPTM